jgi:hypothetical protein
VACEYLYPHGQKDQKHTQCIGCGGFGYLAAKSNRDSQQPQILRVRQCADCMPDALTFDNVKMNNEMRFHQRNRMAIALFLATGLLILAIIFNFLLP